MISKDKYQDIGYDGVVLPTVDFNQLPQMEDGDYKANEEKAKRMIELHYGGNLGEAPSPRSAYDFTGKDLLVEVKVRTYSQSSNYWETFFLEKTKKQGLDRASKKTGKSQQLLVTFEPHLDTDRYWCDVHVYKVDTMEPEWVTKSFRKNNQTSEYIDKDVHYFKREDYITAFRFKQELFQIK